MRYPLCCEGRVGFAAIRDLAASPISGDGKSPSRDLNVCAGGHRIALVLFGQARREVPPKSRSGKSAPDQVPVSLGAEAHSMEDPEKNRLAMTVVDRWCSFHEALGGTKRKYPTGEFLSFAEAARSYIDLTQHDQLIHRDVANAINGLTEFLRLERKRVPGRILSEADRLEYLFFGGFDPHFEGDEPPGL